MKAIQAKIAAKGIDTIQPISMKNALDLKSSGIDFVIRYVNSITPAEIEGLLNAKMPFMLVTYAKAYDAGSLLDRLKFLSIPKDATIAFDLEAEKAENVSAIISKSNQIAKLLKASNKIPMIYYGAGLQLTSSELYLLEFTRYWESCSKEMDRFNKESSPRCDPCMIQLYPPNQPLCGLTVDYDIIQMDFNNRLPTWIVDE